MDENRVGFDEQAGPCMGRCMGGCMGGGYVMGVLHNTAFKTCDKTQLIKHSTMRPNIF